MMRFDMHCHTKYGSIDAKPPIRDYVKLLKEKGYHGMLVTDHDSYRGYFRWREKHPEDDPDFTVLCGIEYDTRDAGHFLVILPDGIYLEALTMRGMDVMTLLMLVHEYGGIIGPAHPFGVRSSSAMFFNKLREKPELLRRFDFVEAFNACESHESNRLATLLAEDYNKPSFGGSDSHDHKYIGMAYTDFYQPIRCNNDVIRAVKERSNIEAGGKERGVTFKSKHKEAFYSIYGFMAFNQSLGAIFYPFRKMRIKQALKNKPDYTSFRPENTDSTVR